MNATDLAQLINGGLIQQDRLMKTDIQILPKNALIPHRAVINSEIGRDFSVSIDMVSTASDIELKKLIAQPMTLWIQQADKSYSPINGYIHIARRLGSDGSFTSYQLTYASWMHFLRFRSDMRYWQDKSADAIITDIFNMHPQAQGQFQFALSKPLPQRSYCRQSETDWNFVHRVMEEEGLFAYWQHAEDGKSHTLVVTDNIYALGKLSPSSVLFSRSGTGNESNALTQWSGSRSLQSTAHTTRTFDYKAPSSAANPKGTSLPTMPGQGELPEQAEVYEYTGAYTYSDQERGENLSRIRLEEWESRAKRFVGTGGARGIDAGLRFELSGHPEHDHDAVSQREFAAIKAQRYIENNLPLSTHEANFPHSLHNEFVRVKTAHAGETVTLDDGTVGFYLVHFEAQRVTAPYRSPFEHHKPQMHLETAIVVGPQGEEVYTDELNRVKVMFIWDRQNSGDAGASCWVRVAQSDTGGGYGSVHVPRVGEEVLIGYVGGDCDRPIVLHRVYNGSIRPQWHSNGILSGYRSKEYSGTGYNEMVLDDATGQNRMRLFSSTGNSLLHLGYLIDHSGNSRGAYLGSGFDLKTDSYGAVRASQGLYLTTHPKQVNSQQLHVQETQEQLVTAESLIESLSTVSTQHQADALTSGHQALKQFTDSTEHSTSSSVSNGRTAGGGNGNANGFKSPVMLFGSPSGVAISTQESAHISAGQQLNLVSSQSTHFVAGRSLIASVVDKLSLFVQNAGMKLIAAAGKIRIEAHSDEMSLAALKDLTVTSTDGKITLNASKEIWIGVGGSYIRITPQGIENGTTGQILEKCAQWSLPGAASMRMPLPDLPGEKPYSAQFTVKDKGGNILRNYPYRLESESGPTWYGRTDDNGLTQRVWLASAQNVHLHPHDFSHDTEAHVDDPHDC